MSDPTTEFMLMAERAFAQRDALQIELSEMKQKLRQTTAQVLMESLLTPDEAWFVPCDEKEAAAFIVATTDRIVAALKTAERGSE